MVPGAYGNALFGQQVRQVGVVYLQPLRIHVQAGDQKSQLVPGAERIWYVADAMRAGMSVVDTFGMP